MIKKWDIVLIAILLVLSFVPEGLFALSQSRDMGRGTVAVVTINGKTVKEIPLSSHGGTDTFTIQGADGGYNVIVVKDQSIGITEADCPDKICIQEGFISRPGESVICLPHKVMVEVKAEGNAEPDIIPAR